MHSHPPCLSLRLPLDAPLLHPRPPEDYASDSLPQAPYNDGKESGYRPANTRPAHERADKIVKTSNRIFRIPEIAHASGRKGCRRGTCPPQIRRTVDGREFEVRASANICLVVGARADSKKLERCQEHPCPRRAVMTKSDKNLPGHDKNEPQRSYARRSGNSDDELNLSQ